MSKGLFCLLLGGAASFSLQQNMFPALVLTPCSGCWYLASFPLLKAKAGQMGPAKQRWDVLIAFPTDVRLHFYFVLALQQLMPMFAAELMEILKAQYFRLQ